MARRGREVAFLVCFALATAPPAAIRTALPILALGYAFLDALPDVQLADEVFSAFSTTAATSIGPANPVYAIRDALDVADPKLHIADLTLTTHTTKAAAAVGAADAAKALRDAHHDARALQEVAFFVGPASAVYGTAGAVFVEDLVAHFVATAVSAVGGTGCTILLVWVAVAIAAYRCGHHAFVPGLVAHQAFVALPALSATAIRPTETLFAVWCTGIDTGETHATAPFRRTAFAVENTGPTVFAVGVHTFAIATAGTAVVRTVEAVLRAFADGVSADGASVYAHPLIAFEARLAGAARFAAGVHSALEAFTGSAAVDSATAVLADLRCAALKEVAPETVQAGLNGIPVTLPLALFTLEHGADVYDGGVALLF